MSTPTSTVKPVFSPSERLANVKPYLLAKVFGAKDEQLRKGVDVIDLGVGNPDLRPPDEAIRALEEALHDPTVHNHQYPPFAGLPEFKQAVAGASPEKGVLLLVRTPRGNIFVVLKE